uniref:hypothetical protein n=1 Tax=Candidatus Cardinium sp. cByotN1 TaxID=2699439 RepID=UPI001FB1C01A
KVDASLAGYDETLNQLLENFIEKYRQTLQKKFPPRLRLIDDTAQTILNSLASHEPQLAAASGALPFIKKDSNGKVMVQENNTSENDTADYCVAGRLFGQALKEQHIPLVQVALSSPYLNKFYLNSFIYPTEDQTIPYRFDLFGGNRMKCPTETVQDLISHKPRSCFGYLLAVPFSELNTDSAFGHFLSRLFPYKESFFYFQRALLARPMKIPGRTDQKD